MIINFPPHSHYEKNTEYTRGASQRFATPKCVSAHMHMYAILLYVCLRRGKCGSSHLREVAVVPRARMGQCIVSPPSRSFHSMSTVNMDKYTISDK